MTKWQTAAAVCHFSLSSYNELMRNSLFVPWSGTLTLDVTIRQKLVRVLSSAAVCGLSISFIVGEAVDHKARHLLAWSQDASLLPAAFLPLQPLRLSLEKFSTDKIGTALAAANSFDVQPEAEPAPVFQDSLRNILAAPVDAPAPKNKNPSLYRDREKTIFTAKAQPDLNNKEVERVLLSIHTTTAQLARPLKSTTSGVAQEKVVVKSLPDHAPPQVAQTEAGVTPVEDKVEETRMLATAGDEVIFGGSEPAAFTTEVPEATPPLEKKEWLIRGRITAGFTLLEPGHFEVTLFSKVDQDGVPVGYPLAQKILPAGITDFQLKVPAKVEGGYLYGEYVVTQTGKRTWIAPPVNPWARNDRQFAELVLKREDTISTVAAAPSLLARETRDVFRIRGNVSTLFAKEGASIPQDGVVIKVRGRKESTRSDRFGAFAMEIPRVRGVIFLEFLKAGYHPTLVAVPSEDDNQPLKVELASRTAIEQIAAQMNTRQVSTKGVFMGRAVGADGMPIKGLSVQLSGKAEGPYYFKENGFPSSEPKATTSDGRFLFLNVEPGTGFVDSSLAGEAIAPFLLSTVEGGEMVSKTLTPVTGSIKGRLFNPVSAKGKLLPVGGARIRVEGSSDWSNSDSYGAFSAGPMRWMKGEKISLEFSAEKYNNHRYLMNPDEKNGALNLYAFPAMYLGRLAASMDIDLDQYSGIVLGKISKMAVRVDALADHSVANSAKDFYFDAKGKLRGSHTMTDPKFGTYVIFNVPKGRTLLQGNDASGALRYSEAIVSTPASISIIMD
jgi:hypothetical protein